MLPTAPDQFWNVYNAPVHYVSDTPAEERRQILAGTEAVFLLLRTPLEIEGVCMPYLISFRFSFTFYCIA